MPRRKLPESTDNHERWLISYADFITLLFAFFVVMYSTASVNDGNFRVLSDSIVAAFTNPLASLDPIQEGTLVRSSVDMVDTPDSVSEAPLIIPLRLPEPTAPPGEGIPDFDNQPVDGEPSTANTQFSAVMSVDLQRIADAAEATISSLIESDMATVRRNARWVEVEVRSNLLFPSGSRVLLANAVPLLSELSDVFSDLPNEIAVEGFTDDRQIRNGLFDSNWELSSARATAIVRELQAQGVEPGRLSATGYGQHRPMADNATEEGRAVNGRVVIVIKALDGVIEEPAVDLLPAVDGG